MKQAAEQEPRERAIARLQHTISRSIVLFCIGSLLYVIGLLFCLSRFAVFFDSYLACILLLGFYLIGFWTWAKQLKGRMVEQEKLEAACRAEKHSRETRLKGFQENLLVFRRR